MREAPIEAARKYVNGVIWPADKKRVIEVAQRNDAPDDAIEIIRSIDHDRLTGPNEVHLALWKAIPTRVLR